MHFNSDFKLWRCKDFKLYEEPLKSTLPKSLKVYELIHGEGLNVDPFIPSSSRPTLLEVKALSKQEIPETRWVCYRCGGCCHGHVTISIQDLRYICLQYKLNFHEICSKLRVENSFATLRDVELNECIFLKWELTENGLKSFCSIYEHRPIGCEMFQCSEGTEVRLNGKWINLSLISEHL